jgi:HD-like signal output (HDOD) protein
MTRADELVEREPGLARIVAVIEEVGSLPTIPLAAQRALALARDDRSSMREIAEVISQDQALAAKVLKIVNSAYYGLRQSVGTLALALTVLGVREITDLVLGVSIVSAFSSGARSELFSREALWRTSAQSAYAGRRVAHVIGLGRFGGEAFLGALVHDIGLVVLDEYLHEAFMEVMRTARQESVEPIVTERRLLGTTHAAVGGWLAETWKFPESLVGAITHHHCPADASWNPPLAALVAVAELIVTCYGNKVSLEEASATLEANATWSRLMASGQPIRPPASTSALLEEVCREIEAAPLIVR